MLGAFRVKRTPGPGPAARREAAITNSMAVRSVLLASGLVLATALMLGLVALQGVTRFTEAVAARRLDQGTETFQRFLSETNYDLNTEAGLLARHPAMAARAEGLEAEQAAGWLLASGGKADFYVIAHPGRDPQVVPEALGPLASGGSGRDGVERAPDGSLYLQATAALEGGGSVAAGMVLGQGFADRFRAVSGFDLSLHSEGRLLGTSMRRPPASGSAAPPAFTSGPAPDHGKRASRWGSLMSSAGEAAAGFVIGLPPASELEELSALNDFFPLLLQLLAIAAISTHLLTRRALLPLRNLATAVSRMSEGDLTTPLVAPAEREVLPLARELEEMRRALHGALSQLAVEKSRYESIFQSMADAVFTTDLDGAVTSVNPAAQKLLQGGVAQGGICCGFQSLKTPEGAPLCDTECIWFSLRQAAEPARARARLAGPPGEPADLEVTIAPVRNERGDAVALVHVLRDVSAQEQLLRLKDRFLMSIAHELRTPLASLSISTELLEDGFTSLPPEEQRRVVEAVQRGTKRLHALVANLLDLGSIQAGRFTVALKAGELGPVIQEARAVVEPLLQEQSQRLEMQAPPDLPVLEMDAARITQVLVNLLTNASKYGPRGDCLVLSAEAGPRRLVVSVTDHGPGISAEDQERIFEYYYRGRDVVKTGAGFGLGLAIARGIVDAHGGELSLESRPGHGATFRFWLPLPVR